MLVVVSVGRCLYYWVSVLVGVSVGGCLYYWVSVLVGVCIGECHCGSLTGVCVKKQ